MYDPPPRGFTSSSQLTTRSRNPCKSNVTLIPSRTAPEEFCIAALKMFFANGYCRDSHVWDAFHHSCLSRFRAPQSSWKRRNGVVSNLCRVSLKPRQSNTPEAVTGYTPVHQAPPLAAGTEPAAGRRQLMVLLMLRQSCKCVRHAASVGEVSATTINPSNAVTRTLGEERRETSSPRFLKQRESPVVRVTRMTPAHMLQRLLGRCRSTLSCSWVSYQSKSTLMSVIE